MQKLVTECESFANKYGLKFNYMKSALLFFLRICVNDVLIPIKTSCRYLGHIITNNLSDNEDIRRQLRCFHGRSSMLLRTFGSYSYDVKLLLFMSYFGSMCTSSIWCKCTKKQYYQMEVAYNNIFRRFFVYDKLSSASQMFVENRVDDFAARMRRLIYGFREWLHASENYWVICLANSAAWSNSKIVSKVGKMFICAIMCIKVSSTFSPPMWSLECYTYAMGTNDIYSCFSILSSSLNCTYNFLMYSRSLQ